MDEFNDNTRYDDDAYAQDTDTQLADATDSYVGTPDDGLPTSGLDDPLPTDDDWMSSLPDFDTPEGQYAPFGGTGDAETSYEDEA